MIKAEAARRQRVAEEDRRMRDRVAKIIGESGMSARFLRRTFDSFERTDANDRAFKAAKDYADHFHELLPGEGNPDPGRNGLFVAGPKGTGKTHLAAAIANQLMQGGTPVICMTMIDLLERIRRTFRASSGASEGEVQRIYRTVPLLIIDDLGKEPATEWATATIYGIINGRYEACLPTIVTTNYDDQQLVRRMTPRDGDATTADATIDRLREMCRGILMTGESWRSR
jgi:DNA replication protein DnaC